MSAPLVLEGYRPGGLGRIVEMHAHHYSRAVGFGARFEALVAGGVAEFAERLDRPQNGLWFALLADRIVGSVAIDGEDMGEGAAHLRWFIVEEASRSGGLGLRLLSTALAFADAQGFARTELWTFRGLDAARRLYEQSGFVCVEERTGAMWGSEAFEQRFARARGVASA